MSSEPAPEIIWADAATYKAGIMAMVVADYFAAGDLHAARAALPAYQEAAAVRAAQLEADPNHP